MNLSGVGYILDDANLAGIALGVFVSLLLANLLGRRFQKLRTKIWPASQSEARRHQTQEGYIVSGTLVLMGLLIGFTFSMAVQRYEERRLLVVSEANALGTSYLRAQILDEPFRTNLSKLLVEYTANRIELGTAARDQRPSLLARNDELLTQIWKGVVAASASARDKGISTPLLMAFNDVIDRDADRKAARLARVPETVLVSLYMFLLVTALLLGSILTGTPQRITAGLFFLLLTMMFSVIVDLNRPTSGSIRESQQPLVLLHRSLLAMPPGSLENS
jgi:hypothetical protein